MTSPNPTGYGLRSRDLPGIHVQAPFTPNSLFVCSSADRLPASAGAWQLVLIPNRDFIAACYEVPDLLVPDNSFFVVCLASSPSLIFAHLRRPQECKGESDCSFVFVSV